MSEFQVHLESPFQSVQSYISLWSKFGRIIQGHIVSNKTVAMFYTLIY